MRRGARATRRGFGSSMRSLFGMVLALSAGRPVFTADYYAIDGVSGKVASFIDWNDPTHTLAQATSANQVAIPATHANYAGKLCVTFTGSEWYVSSRPASYYAPWHDGSGGGSWATLSPTEVSTTYYVCSTFSSAAPGFGMAWNVNHSVLVRQSGTNNTIVASSNVTPALNTPVLYRFSYTEGASPEWRIKTTGGVEVTGNSALAPGSGAAEQTLVFGARAAAVAPAKGRVRHLILTPDLTAGGRTTMEQYIAADCGVAA